MRELNNNDLKKLREAGVLTEKEVAFFTGDLFIAENVITKDRRILESVEKILQENYQQLLKG